MNLIDTYDKEVKVEYRGEIYSVRDNGAILRHSKNSANKRKLDDIWTFGNVDKEKHYCVYGGENVHRIVACAFIGDNDNTDLVVDHIDTNRQNNRPSNLRWVTRFENLVLNERTRAKVEWICGMPIEEILKNITVLHNANLSQNFSWMRTVSQEEALLTLEHWNKWLSEKKGMHDKDDFIQRMIKHNYQKRDNNSGEYPLAPTEPNSSLEDYMNKLAKDAIFFKKTYNCDAIEFRILDMFYNKEDEYIAVATYVNGGIKPYFITYIKRKYDIYEYETRSFFSPNGVDKYMTIAKGHEWTGGDVIDDFC